MTAVSVWHVFAYMDDDNEGRQDERRSVPDWQLEDVLRWCRFRGFDHIYLRRESLETARYQRAAPAPVRHHMHLVEENDAPSGDAA